jgi:hypothetical protein
MAHFFMMVLPFGVTAIAGIIQAGYGWYLWLWLAYSLFFLCLGSPRSMPALSLLGRPIPRLALPRQLRRDQNLEVSTRANEDGGEDPIPNRSAALAWFSFPRLVGRAGVSLGFDRGERSHQQHIHPEEKRLQSVYQLLVSHEFCSETACKYLSCPQSRNSSGLESDGQPEPPWRWNRGATLIDHTTTCAR